MFVIHQSDCVPEASLVQTVASDVGWRLDDVTIVWSLTLVTDAVMSTLSPSAIDHTTWSPLTVIVPVKSAGPGAADGVGAVVTGGGTTTVPHAPTQGAVGGTVGGALDDVEVSDGALVVVSFGPATDT